MKCPQCVEEKQHSHVTVFGGGGKSLKAADVFYDEAGKHHVHDGNGVTTNYKCSRGHEWSDVWYQPCFECGWTGDKPERAR